MNYTHSFKTKLLSATIFASIAFSSQSNASVINSWAVNTINVWCPQGTSIVPNGTIDDGYAKRYRGSAVYIVHLDRFDYNLGPEYIVDNETGKYVLFKNEGSYVAPFNKLLSDDDVEAEVQITHFFEKYGTEFKYLDDKYSYGIYTDGYKSYSEYPALPDCYPLKPDEVEPEPPVPEYPDFKFFNDAYVYCPWGQTVGGVKNGSTYRVGQLGVYGKNGVANDGYYLKDKSGNYSKIPMREENGVQYFPDYDKESDVENYGSWKTGSEQACSVPDIDVEPPVIDPTDPVEPVEPVEPVDPEQPNYGYTYSFDLTYYESCGFNEALGGVAGGSTQRTGKVGVYVKFDLASYTTKSYFFDGSKYVEIEMIQNGEYSTYPQVTKEMVNKYGAFDTNSIEECKALPPVQAPDPVYSFDLFLHEYCGMNETVGGLFDGNTARTGKVPVYYLWDVKAGKSTYFYKEGSAFVQIAMNTINGVETFPTVTVEIAKKYGTIDSNSIEECKAIETPEPEPQPTEPMEGWNETGIEQCAAGQTVGGVEGGSTVRRGNISVWYIWSTDAEYNYSEKYFFHTTNGSLIPFDYNDYPEYKEPNWQFGKNVVEQYGVWHEDSVEECKTVRTFTVETEIQSKDCPANQVGLIKESRTYHLWNDGEKDNFSEWSTLSNTCEVIVIPPVVVPPVEPVEPTEPTEPVDPLEPVEPVEPVEPTEPVEPVEPERFTPISDFTLSTEMCEEGQTGKISYKHLRTYDLYENGEIKNDSGWIKSLLSNSCKDITDEVIEVTSGYKEELCPSGQKGHILILGNYITKALSGTVFEEISREDTCIDEDYAVQKETITESCINGSSGEVVKSRYFAVKNGKTIYPYGSEFTIESSNCQSLDVGNNPSKDVFKTQGLLRNQSIYADNLVAIRELTKYVNEVEIDDDGDYKLNIVASNVKANNADDLALLLNAWVTKTKGKINFVAVPRSAVAFIGLGKITKQNAGNTIINSALIDVRTGNLVVSYKEATKGLKPSKLESFTMPFVNASKAGKALSYVDSDGGKL